MSCRISILAVGLLAVGLTSGAQAQPVASTSRPADRIEVCGLQTLVSDWLGSFFARDHVPSSQGPKRHDRSSRQFQEKEGSHIDPNGLH
jgi:hypothetical protein